MRGGSCCTDIDPDFLNDFYCSVARNLTKDLKPVCDPLSYLSDVNVSSESFHLSPTTPHEVASVIRCMKNRRASGDDGISLLVLEKLPVDALLVLSDVINISFESGYFPACLKTAKIIPLHKGGDHSDPSNFRPISLLSTLSKLIERLVRERLLNFLATHNILNQSQFGFLSGRNTPDAMFNF